MTAVCLNFYSKITQKCFNQVNLVVVVVGGGGGGGGGGDGRKTELKNCYMYL